MDIMTIKEENARLKIENARLNIENARLVAYLRDARDLVQKFEKETRPHSVPLDMPERGRLFSSNSASPDTLNFLRKCAENTNANRDISVSPEINRYFCKRAENTNYRDSE
jgi:hypothetical protein